MTTQPAHLHAKYTAARRILATLSVFITDYKAASVYAKLEAAGWHWDGGRWVRQASR